MRRGLSFGGPLEKPLDMCRLGWLSAGKRASPPFARMPMEEKAGMKLLELAARKARSARHLLLLRIRPPAWRRRISNVMALALPRPDFADGTGAAEAERLRDDGFVLLPDVFPLEKLRRVRAALETHECTDGWRPQHGRFPLEKAPDESNNVHVVDVELIPEVVEIANDPTVLAIVSRYLGCKPTIDDILAWWSLPNRPAPYEEQFFHRDQDSIRFVKLFIYLSDVTEKDGPHTFVRRSHRSNALLDSGRRFTDDEVLAQVPADAIIEFTGPFGTTFLEDTFGLHKGRMPTTGTRLILQVRYTMLPSAFAQPGKKRARVDDFDPYVNRLIATPQG